jgi:hypothetical protein
LANIKKPEKTCPPFRGAKEGRLDELIPIKLNLSRSYSLFANGLSFKMIEYSIVNSGWPG